MAATCLDSSAIVKTGRPGDESAVLRGYLSRRRLGCAGDGGSVRKKNVSPASSTCGGNTLEDRVIDTG